MPTIFRSPREVKDEVGELDVRVLHGLGLQGHPLENVVTEVNLERQVEDENVEVTTVVVERHNVAVLVLARLEAARVGAGECHVEQAIADLLEACLGEDLLTNGKI